MSMHNWTDIAKNMTKGRTILVLGPDAVPYYPTGAVHPDTFTAATGEMTFSRLCRGAILDCLDNKITHFYERDNLFLFKSARDKRDAMDIVEECSKSTQWLPDAELMRKIVAMPFPLVLNLSPDKGVYEAFLKYYREPQFDYFSVNHKPQASKISQVPDCYDAPMVYNLGGSITDALDSVILDHFDLFNMLKKLLNDEGVPREITETLRKSDRFVLLGMELERWYFQLFLHYVNRLDGAFDNYNQNFPILAKVGEHSRDFLMKQFNIEHFSANRIDFDALYEACVAQGNLRTINDPASEAELQVRMLVTQGKMEEAFRQFEAICTDRTILDIDLPALRSRYYALQKNETRMDSRDAATERNSIRYALLTYVAEQQKIAN